MFRSLRFFVYVGTADYEKLRFLDIGEFDIADHWQKLTNVVRAHTPISLNVFLDFFLDLSIVFSLHVQNYM